MIASLLLALVAVPANASATCQKVDGDRISFGDLATADARFSVADPQIDIGYAPEPGAKRVFWAAELSHLAARANVPSVDPFAAVCFERRTRTIAETEVQEAVQVWAPGAVVRVVEQSQFPLPPGELVVPRPTSLRAAADGNVLLHGYVSWGKSRRSAFWVKARLTWKQMVVVAVEPLVPGSPIRLEQLKIEEQDKLVDLRPASTDAATVAGKEVRKRIEPGQVVYAADLKAFDQVRRGAVVKVEVRNGGAYLSFDGEAQTDGSTGDIVAVRNPSSGKSFKARVTGENSVLLSLRSSRSL